VEQQDYGLVEHIVVDDGSNDDSVPLLESWSGTRLRWRSEANRGQAAALNEAFQMSSGQILGWLSSDDVYYDRGVVSAVVAAFGANPEVAFVYGHAVVIDADGFQMCVEWVPPVRAFNWRPPMRIIQPAVFIRRSALTDRLVDESFDIAMDTELWLRLRRDHPIARLDRILAAERHHGFRKSYIQIADTESEALRLDGIYGPKSRVSDPRHKKWAILYRLAGVLLVPRIAEKPSGFSGDLDSRMRLLIRQVAYPRSRMTARS